MSKSIDEHEGKKYLHRIVPVKIISHGNSNDGKITPPSFEVDVYAVLKAFKVTCPARAHAIKKLLCCGNRGKGSAMSDLLGVEAAVARAIELQRIDDLETVESGNAPSKV